jgi:hypothetical protein
MFYRTNPKKVVLITDGQSRNFTQTLEESERMWKHAEVMAVGYGGYNTTEILVRLNS